MRNIRIVIWGFGAMGSGIARMILEKQGLEITGVLDTWDELVGKNIYDRLDLDPQGRDPVYISNQPEEVISKDQCDLVVLATDSFTAKAFPKLKFCVERGVNVVTTAEEMAWPWAQEPELSAGLDRLARKHKVSILGTGVNPGFILDLLVVCLTGACEHVDSIEAARINDLSPFGKAVMEEQGVGMDVEAFNQLNAAGKLSGHVGFPESVGIITQALGWQVKKFEQTKGPIVSQVERKASHFDVKAGKVAGVRQQCFAYGEDGKQLIHLDHPQQVYPELEGTETGDYITIHTGSYDMNLRIKPETPGGIGTIAMIVNMIPAVINAEPGLLNLLDLPIPRAYFGDWRKQITANQEARRLYKAGDLVTIEQISLPAGERADSVPTDTANTPLLLWVKGKLKKDAYTGEEVEVETEIGRVVTGRLTNYPVNYQHHFGEYVPELAEVRQLVKAVLWEEA